MKAAIAGALLVLGSVAGAAPKPAPPPPVWLGVFDPKLGAHPPWDNPRRTPVDHGGAVRVLTSADRPPASGDVIVVHPLLGKTAAGKIEGGAVAIAAFAYDQRDGDDGVVVVPAGTPVALVALSKADDAAIRATLMKGEALAHVKRALAELEAAGVDLDGDGKADLAMTYGCSAWFDGSCQSRGQFVLTRAGARWAIVD
ncbi:MAG TPA: hypothetical protein VGC42_12725 [Kofleriaceae bacterium]